MKKRLILIVVVCALSLAADQATKQLARASLRGKIVDIIPGVLALEYHENPGMAFGLGRSWPGGRYIMIAIGLIALALVWRLVRDVERRQKMADVAYGLVAGGAIGNLIDRVYIGRVVDFIVMHWKRKAQWPAYNVADAALVLGVIMLVFALGKKDKKTEGKGRDKSRSKARAAKGKKKRDD